jgi:hypothetical protein
VGALTLAAVLGDVEQEKRIATKNTKRHEKKTELVSLFCFVLFFVSVLFRLFF